MTATTPLRAIGYVRVSTEEQAAQGHSLAMQPARIRQWCALRDPGLELVGMVLDEGVSAGKPLRKRPGGAELMRRIEAGEADVLVTYRLDRLFRDAQDGLNFVRDTLADAGVALQSITELIDTTTPVGKLCLTMLLGVGEYERDVTRERNRATTASLRQRGRKYASTPYGCVAVGGAYDPAAGRVTGQLLYRCPGTWPHRETIVALAAERDARGRRPSLQAISDELFARGIPAPAGGRRWVKASVSRVIASHGELNHIAALPEGQEALVSGGAA